MLNIFSCADWPFVYLFWRNVYICSLPIFELGCFCCWVAGVLYTLWILTSYQIYRINIFSHSVDCILFDSSLIFNHPTCFPSVFFLVLSGPVSGPFCGWATTSQHRTNCRKSFSRSPLGVSYDFEHLVGYQFKSVPFCLDDSFITFILHGNLSKPLLLAS